MRKELKPSPTLFPLPVLLIATYCEDGTPDVMNAAWGGIYDDDKIIINLSTTHVTSKNIKRLHAFTVSPADRANLIPADFVGIVSAEKEPGKVAKAGWHAVKSGKVDAPLIEELPLSFECTLDSYAEVDGCTHFVGKIVGVSADEGILGDDGRISADKLEPISFDPAANEYRVLGGSVGKAFSEGLALK